jgi:acyl-CoA hydrolase
VQVSPPDAHGFVSLGMSVDITMSFLRYAKTIVAEINPLMPRTLGDTFLHVDRIDRFVRVDRPFVEYAHQPVDTVSRPLCRRDY